jgi:hypothetical protein
MKSEMSEVNSNIFEKSTGSDKVEHLTTLLRFYSSKLFAVTDNDVEMFVKGKESSDQHSVIVDSHSYSEVNPVPKFALHGTNFAAHFFTRNKLKF